MPPLSDRNDHAPVPPPRAAAVVCALAAAAGGKTAAGRLEALGHALLAEERLAPERWRFALLPALDCDWERTTSAAAGLGDASLAPETPIFFLAPEALAENGSPLIVRGAGALLRRAGEILAGEEFNVAAIRAAKNSGGALLLVGARASLWRQRPGLLARSGPSLSGSEGAKLWSGLRWTILEMEARRLGNPA